jgi:signal transduction histidine kinase
MADRAADVQRVYEAYTRHEANLPAKARREMQMLKTETDVNTALDDLVNIARVIRRSSDRAGRIVRDLLSFSRASSDRVPTDLRKGIEETLTLLGPQLERASISIETRFSPIPEIFVRADEMNQVFMNLLTNAVQAVEGRKPATIRVETAVESPSTNACHVRIAIEDDGPGIADVVKARIFDPFFTTKPAGKGTGLGLSISSQIVARHGGTLTLERTSSGSGARFVLRLPAT